MDLLDLVVALVKLDQLDLLELLDPQDPLDHPVVDSTLASLLHPRRKPLIPSVTTVLMMPM